MRDTYEIPIVDRPFQSTAYYPYMGHFVLGTYLVIEKNAFSLLDNWKTFYPKLGNGFKTKKKQVEKSYVASLEPGRS